MDSGVNFRSLVNDLPPSGEVTNVNYRYRWGLFRGGIVNYPVDKMRDQSRCDNGA
jgi:hypothetical protein